MPRARSRRVASPIERPDFALESWNARAVANRLVHWAVAGHVLRLRTDEWIGEGPALVSKVLLRGRRYEEVVDALAEVRNRRVAAFSVIPLHGEVQVVGEIRNQVRVSST